MEYRIAETPETKKKGKGGSSLIAAGRVVRLLVYGNQRLVLGVDREGPPESWTSVRLLAKLIH